MSALARKPSSLRTLVLNADARPLSTWPLSLVSAQDAISAVWRERATVVETWEGAFFHSPSITLAVPKVMMLREYAPISGEPKFCRRSILLRDRFRCFVAGTRVLMADGRQVPIEHIQVGDRVIDAFGVPVTVINRGSRIADDCVVIKHRGSFERTTVTQDHPFLDGNSEFTEIGSMEIAEGRGGSYLTFPRCVRYELPAAIDLNVPALLPADRWFRLRGGRVHRTRNRADQGLPLSLPQSEHLAYLLGLYVAEGSATKEGVVAFNFSADEAETLAADAAGTLESALGLKAYKNIDRWRNTCVVRVGSKSLAEIMWAYCGKGARDKKTPWNLIGPYHSAYLRGLFAGDAHIDNKRRKVVLSMTSSAVIFGAQAMLWGLGIQPTFQRIEVLGKLPAFTLVLNAANRSAFMHNVMGEAVEDGDVIFGSDTHVFRRLQERTPTDDDRVVYNIEVDGSHSYIANGLAVHNCQYCGERFDSSDLTFDHVRPRAKGGKTEWTNIAAACLRCNARKADRPHMRPRTEPRRPTNIQLLQAGLEFLPNDIRDDFGSWLYWNTELRA